MCPPYLILLSGVNDLNALEQFYSDCDAHSRIVIEHTCKCPWRIYTRTVRGNNRPQTDC